MRIPNDRESWHLRPSVTRASELYQKYGAETVDASIERILAAGEEQARAAVRAMPDGEWEAEDWMDNDGVNDDLPHRLRADLRFNRYLGCGHLDGFADDSGHRRWW